MRKVVQDKVSERLNEENFDLILAFKDANVNEESLEEIKDLFEKWKQSLTPR